MNQDNRPLSSKDTKKADQSPILSDKSSPYLIKDDATALEVMLGNTRSSPSARNRNLGSRLTKIYSRAPARRRIALICLSFATLLLCLIILGLIELLEKTANR